MFGASEFHFNFTEAGQTLSVAKNIAEKELYA